MCVDLLEKLVAVLASLTIVIAGAAVGFFTFAIDLSSGVSREEVVATFAVADWIELERRSIAPATTSPPIPAPSRARVEPIPAASGEAPPPRGDSPRVPPGPPQEGWTYLPPRPIPEVVYRRFQGFEEAFEEAQQGSGELVNGRYRLTRVEPGSLLATRIGLRAGDEIISINGHPIAGGLAERRQLFDTLKTERRFTVALLRDGQPTMLTFRVE